MVDIEKRPHGIRDGIIASAIWWLIQLGGPTMITWLATHFAVIAALPTYQIILIGVAVFFVVAVGLNVLMKLLTKSRAMPALPASQILTQSGIVNSPHFEFNPTINMPVSQSQAQQQTIYEEPPNIILCFDEIDNDIEIVLDENYIFRQSNSPDALQAVVIKFRNEPKPPQKIGASKNVTAHILYEYQGEFGEDSRYQTDYPCWLNMNSSRISFDIGASYQLILGAFESNTAAEITGGRGFMFCDNNLIRRFQQTYPKAASFRITVKILWGDGYQFGKKETFELKITYGKGLFKQTFELIHLDERGNRRSRGLSIML